MAWYTNLLIVVAVALGFPVLLVSCALRAWTKSPTFPSIKPWPWAENQGPYRPLVDEWRWELLNKWYGNSEDGVSGAQAWIWENGVVGPVAYYSTFPSWVPQWVKAYCWSAWRNSANNLKRPLRGDSNVGIVP